MQVLARHSARLGPAGPGLEAAVRRVLSRAQGAGGQAAISLAESWDFFERQDGLAAYQALRSQFLEIFNRAGTTREGDREVLSHFPRTSAGPSWPPASERSTAQPSAGVIGSVVELPTEDVRFAHNDQSERFGHGSKSSAGGGCVLQLAAELLAGLTRPADVPEFTVCWHEGHWFCRSGNRRLAAFRLVRRFAPERFGRVRVRAVEADDIFVHGNSRKRPKLTTQQNGEHCKGRWMMIRETGEPVGCGRPDRPEYGADLLALLPFAPLGAEAVGGA